jgi:DHA1 family bicyclomycin/chloramphenicol resistance-like MFS transporter
MMNESQKAPQSPEWPLGHREFVAMIGLLMASNAFAIDIMLPALPDIGRALDIDTENHRQLLVTVFLLGFGGGQIIYGPLSDRFGRKRILAFSLALYAVAALLSSVAQSFTLLLAARILHGIAAAGSRVLLTSIVRDRFRGSEMARMMSFAMIVFLVAPVLAPSIGQAVLAVANWRAIFIVLTVYAAVVLTWSGLRLPETLPVERRRPLTFAKVGEAIALTVRHRVSIGNTLATCAMFGALFGFINSIQQIVFDTFGSGEHFGLIFAACAATMAASAYLNARIVVRVGSRQVLLGGLVALVAITALHALLNLLFGETIGQFIVLQALTLATFGLITGNLSSIAMQPMGHIAGTASSVQGVITTLGGALIGFIIGQAFNGSTQPLVVGSLLCGLAGLALALWANRQTAADGIEKGAA